MTTYYNDSDHVETQEWLDAFESVIKNANKERAQFLLKALYNKAVQEGLPFNRVPISMMMIWVGIWRHLHHQRRFMRLVLTIFGGFLVRTPVAT